MKVEMTHYNTCGIYVSCYSRLFIVEIISVIYFYWIGQRKCLNVGRTFFLHSLYLTSYDHFAPLKRLRQYLIKIIVIYLWEASGNCKYRSIDAVLALIKSLNVCDSEADLFSLLLDLVSFSLRILVLFEDLRTNLLPQNSDSDNQRATLMRIPVKP